jgi:hypothetical protein
VRSGRQTSHRRAAPASGRLTGWTALARLLLLTVGLVSALCTTAARAIAQAGRITGVVVSANRDSTAVAGAQVALRSPGAPPFGTVTGADGRFSFGNVPAGDYTVEVARVGYGRASESVTVGANAEAKVRIALPVVSVDLQAVTVAFIAPNPRSPWIGAKVAIPFSGGTSVDDFQAYGQAKLEVLGKETHHYATYVFGNVSRLNADPSVDDLAKANEIKLRELQQSAQGVTFSVVPHVFWGDAQHESVTLYAPIGYKVNALKDTLSETRYLNQFRFGAAAGFTFLQGVRAGLPVGLTIGAAWSAFSSATFESVFRERRSVVGTVDAELIVPAGAGVGFLVESSMPIAGGGKTVFRAGLALAPGGGTSRP